MNKPTSIKTSGSLLERAAEMYDFQDMLRGELPPAIPAAVPTSAAPQPESPAPAAPLAAAQYTTAETQVYAPAIVAPAPVAAVQPAMVPTVAIQPAPTQAIAPAPIQAPVQAPAIHAEQPTHIVTPQPTAKHNIVVDRAKLVANNFIDPLGPVSGLSEEFRIVKRQLLLSARGGKGHEHIAHGERILVCSAHPNEGKTYCAVNLALSIAQEKDNRVLLIDADFAKPSIPGILGVSNSPGFMDALVDPALSVEDCVVGTNIEGLSILPAGRQTNQDTEFLASARTAELIEQLTRNDPSRILIFDSPPALAASPASVLALHVGQCLMVVRADETTDSALRDALNLLGGCEHVQLLLNRAKFSPTGRKFGSYYGYGA